MAENKTIELRYFRLASDDARPFRRVWTLIDKQTGEPLATPDIAALHINSGRKQYLTLTLGDGLTWDEATHTLTVLIENDRLSFIREDGEFHYECFVEVNKVPMTIREGTVNAVRVG